MKKRIIYKELLLNDLKLLYLVRYSQKAKYLQLRITPSNQLELVIPRRFSLKEGEKFLNSKVDWIKKFSIKLSRDSKQKFLLLGREIKVNHSYNFFLEKHKVKFFKEELSFESPAESKLTTSELFNLFLKREAKNYIPERAIELADKYKFKINNISIRGQKTRWGSCSSKGNLNFNYKLMQFRKEIIDYVIIHELCHLREMNHSKEFWILVENYCPDYRMLRREIRNKNY